MSLAASTKLNSWLAQLDHVVWPGETSKPEGGLQLAALVVTTLVDREFVALVLGQAADCRCAIRNFKRPRDRSRKL